LMLPPRCLRCGLAVDGQGRLCAECWRSLTFLGPPQCRLCGYPLPHALPEAPLCGECAREAPVYDRARAALRYDDGARRLILAFKHADRTDVAPAFGAWLARAGAELIERLTARVKALHPYACPCVVALPIAGGNREYLDWIAAETAPALRP
ncbi:MAG: divalent cation tolerance protein CutA, partial [Geminicoccaceae bacterium]